MGLSFSDEALQDSENLMLIAKDTASGSAVFVKISLDVSEEVGLDRAQQVAQAKYAAGQFEPDGSVYVGLDDLDGGRS